VEEVEVAHRLIGDVRNSLFFVLLYTAKMILHCKRVVIQYEVGLQDQWHTSFADAFYAADQWLCCEYCD
jgi:hypothetical protein